MTEILTGLDNHPLPAPASNFKAAAFAAMSKRQAALREPGEDPSQERLWPRMLQNQVDSEAARRLTSTGRRVPRLSALLPAGKKSDL